VTRREYLAEVIRLYLEAEETPARTSRRDWAIAGDLYRHGVPVEHIGHAIRVAALRRRSHRQATLETIRSLAYYRAVLHGLTPEHLEPDYVAYVARAYRTGRLSSDEKTKPRLRDQNVALWGSR